MQAPAADKSKEEKDEVDESKFDEFMGNDAGTFHSTLSVWAASSLRHSKASCLLCFTLPRHFDPCTWVQDHGTSLLKFETLMLGVWASDMCRGIFNGLWRVWSGWSGGWQSLGWDWWSHGSASEGHTREKAEGRAGRDAEKESQDHRDFRRSQKRARWDYDSSWLGGMTFLNLVRILYARLKSADTSLWNGPRNSSFHTLHDAKSQSSKDTKILRHYPSLPCWQVSHTSCSAREYDAQQTFPSFYICNSPSALSQPCFWFSTFWEQSHVMHTCRPFLR